jgi:hypothetical protein
MPHFSSGPCAKRPGWSLQALTDAVLGRSHRSKIGKVKLKRAIDLTREIRGVPANYRIGIVPASDTGAVEMAIRPAWVSTFLLFTNVFVRANSCCCALPRVKRPWSADRRGLASATRHGLCR